MQYQVHACTYHGHAHPHSVGCGIMHVFQQRVQEDIGAIFGRRLEELADLTLAETVEDRVP